MLRISEKIAIAKDLYGQWRDALGTDSGIAAQLRELSARVAASGASCIRSGVAETCRLCERDEGGSCCGAGIEDRYTPELLLINLMLGVSLPESRRSAKNCHFLGECGCLLPARDIICINYLCGRLKRTIAPEELQSLQDTNGSEMELLFILHDRIRNFIRRESA
jgi:hypothetical protein